RGGECPAQPIVAETRDPLGEYREARRNARVPCADVGSADDPVETAVERRPAEPRNQLTEARDAQSLGRAVGIREGTEIGREMLLERFKHRCLLAADVRDYAPGTPLVVEYSKCSASPGWTSG